MCSNSLAMNMVARDHFRLTTHEGVQASDTTHLLRTHATKNTR